MSDHIHAPAQSDEETSIKRYNDDPSGSTLRLRVPPGPQPRSTFKSIVLVLTVTFAMIINLANFSAASIALPTIQRELDLQEAQLQWIISSYPLCSGCLLLAFGRVADVHGRKKTFLSGATLLTIFTLACAFAQDVTTLATLRGIQGIGAAAMLPAGLGILAHAFPPSHARSLAFATFSSGAAVGAVIGNTIGGTLSQFTKQTWRSSFYLLAGFNFVVLVSGLFSIDADLPSQETDKRVDWIGAALVTIGLVLIVFVLGQGELAPHKWATPYIIVLLIVGFVFLGFFISWQYYLEKRFDDPKSTYSVFMPPPLMRISLWTRAHGRLAVIMIVCFTLWGSFVSWVYWLQLYYQNYRHFSAMQNVIRLLPMLVSGLLASLFIGLMAAYVPLVWLIGIGTLLTSTAIVLFIMSKPSMTYWPFEFPAMWLSVLGVDIVFPTGSLFIAKFALPHEQSMAGALFTAMTQLGSSFGITVTTVMFNRVTLSRPPGADTMVGYHAANWTSAGFSLIAFTLGVLFFRGVGVVGHRRPKTTCAEESEKETSASSPGASSKTA